MKRMMAAALMLLSAVSSMGQRRDVLMDEGWSFRFSHQVEKGTAVRVDLPHTWNAQDALAGKMDYKRGIGNYERPVQLDASWRGKRLFLRFEGANSVADVFVNGRHAAEHRGGYGAFAVEITDKVDFEKPNSLLVRVANSERLDLMPLVGDFNFYGGLYRDVHLLVTDGVCISPLDHGSPGVRLVQESVSRREARVRAEVRLSNGEAADSEVELRVSVKDGDRTVAEQTRKVLIKAGEETVSPVLLDIAKPHLWDGTADPFLYRAEISVIRNGRTTDSVVQPLGLRYFHIDPDKGFFLNGRHLALHGVCRHQDRSEVGNALRREHHDEDAALMVEMGVNAVRLAHYPQSTYFYDLMDRLGIIVWAEIPFVGPGGYSDKGFVDSPAFRENGKEQLRELIRQHANHPSICLWGLFNELKAEGDNPLDYIRELNDLAHQEDPTRPTTAASNQQGDMNLVTDAIAWNRYDGWYGGTPADLGRWLDQTHARHPELRIAISEYGAGASVYHQQDSLAKPSPAGRWHPENWQTWYHRANWRELSARPFVWGTFVWNMFDFGAAHRTEGDRTGINDKGLVTFDRRTRKDAFYFYKANWNRSEPMLHLADKRCTRRTHRLQTVTAFTNLPEAELMVNGKSMGRQKADSLSVVEWKEVELQPGDNELRVVAKSKGKTLTDTCRCTLEE